MNKSCNYDVLLTGGAGFIGSAIVDYLLKVGKTVVCLDADINSGRLKSFGDRIVRVQGDILNTELIDHWVNQCGRVMHLAAIVGVDEYVNRPHEVLDVNILGTRNVLMSCLKHQRPVLICSSSETYGLNTGILAENSQRIYGSPLNHRWSYAISKAAGEHYAYALERLGLTSVAVRYFNVYGPQLDAPGRGRVISKFLGCIRDRRPLTLVDGGDAVRTLCYVDDAAEATARLALELSPEAPFRNTAVNIGRSEPITMKELAQIMIRLSGHQYGTEDVPGTTFFGEGFEEIPVRVPDVSRLHELLDFKPKVDLEDGLKRTLAHWNLLAPEQEPIENGNGKVELVSTGQDKPIIPMVRPHFAPNSVLLQSYHQSLATGQATNGGPHLQAFEAELADYLGVPDVVAVSNGADALILSMQVLGLKGKAVLPSYTFIATLNSVIACGLEPIFCDIDPETFTLSPSALADILAREEGVSCVLPVNVFGVSPDMEAIAQLCRQANIQIVYDNCHGFGSEVNGKRTASEAIMQTFSFHATKVLPAIEGGAVISPDLNLLNEIRRLRNHGIAPNVIQSTPGMNAKMDELRAATGRHVLKSFPHMLEQRRRYAQQLRGFLTEFCPDVFIPQRVPNHVNSNFQNLGIVCPVAEQVGLNTIIGLLKSNGIECRSYFNPALHCLEMYHGKFHLPNTEKIWRSLLCFPIHSTMSQQDLQQIKDAALATVESLLANSVEQPVMMATARMIRV